MLLLLINFINDYNANKYNLNNLLKILLINNFKYLK